LPPRVRQIFVDLYFRRSGFVDSRNITSLLQEVDACGC
jgi:hypothetical protein